MQNTHTHTIHFFSAKSGGAQNPNPPAPAPASAAASAAAVAPVPAPASSSGHSRDAVESAAGSSMKAKKDLAFPLDDFTAHTGTIVRSDSSATL